MPTIAVIWDLDGVLIDSGPYHFQAWQRLHQEAGLPFSEADFRETFGQRNQEIIRIRFGRDLPEGQVAELARKKEELYRQAARGRVKPLPGALELLHSLQTAGFRMALVSSTTRENIEMIMQELALAPCFQATVSGEDVAEGKPSPQGFLLAAQLLKVEPRQAVVIEDAPAGLEAARAAGMRCIAVASTHPRERLVRADLVVDSLAQVTVANLRQL